MLSDAQGQFFDGQTAASQPADIEIRNDALVIQLASGAPRHWSLSGLEAASPVREHQDLRLKHASEPAARLTVPAGPAADLILARARHLQSRFSMRRVMKFVAILIIGFVCVAVVGYAVLNLAPQQVAAVLPDNMRALLADHAERSFLNDHKICNNSDGVVVLRDMADRVAAADPNSEGFTIRVIDMPFVNAFALPAGRIVLTNRLIQAADGPDEVAGVIAHELGHTNLRHPEASFVRVVGLQILLSVFTGGTSSDTVGGLAGLLAILSYSRAAEIEADAYAVRLLTDARVDPKGLRHFFEKLYKKEFSLTTGALKDLTDMLSTHPGTKERIEQIQPLPPGAAEPVITKDQWRQLKGICNVKISAVQRPGRRHAPSTR